MCTCKDNLVESYKYKGFTIKIKQDSDYGNPRKEWDCWLGKMVCWHSRYELGDKHDSKDPDHLLSELFQECPWGTEEARLICLVWARSDKEMYREFLGYKDGESREEFWSYIVEDKIIGDRMDWAPKEVKQLVADIVQRHFVILPLYLYDHSGITMSTSRFSCPWDSGQVGFIYMSLKDAQREYDALIKYEQEHPEWKRVVEYKDAYDFANKRLNSEVEVYDQCLTGQVYGYIVEDEDGNELDSCWGNYGLDYCKECAEKSADYYEKELGSDFQI